MSSSFKEIFGNPTDALKNLIDVCEFPWEMLEKLEMFLNELPLGKHLGTIHPKACLRNPELVFLGEGAEIGPDVYIEGKAYIGNHAKVRHGAFLRGPVFMDDYTVCGHATELKKAILFPHASAAHFNYVGDSILGEKSQLGAGAICANLRFDKKEIIVRFLENRFVTKQKKLGALIGKETKVGCHAVLSPGTTIAPFSQILPQTSVKGYIQ